MGCCRSAKVKSSNPSSAGPQTRSDGQEYQHHPQQVVADAAMPPPQAPSFLPRRQPPAEVAAATVQREVPRPSSRFLAPASSSAFFCNGDDEVAAVAEDRVKSEAAEVLGSSSSSRGGRDVAGHQLSDDIRSDLDILFPLPMRLRQQRTSVAESDKGRNNVCAAPSAVFFEDDGQQLLTSSSTLRADDKFSAPQRATTTPQAQGSTGDHSNSHHIEMSPGSGIRRKAGASPPAHNRPRIASASRVSGDAHDAAEIVCVIAAEEPERAAPLPRHTARRERQWVRPLPANADAGGFSTPMWLPGAMSRSPSNLHHSHVNVPVASQSHVSPLSPYRDQSTVMPSVVRTPPVLQSPASFVYRADHATPSKPADGIEKAFRVAQRVFSSAVSPTNINQWQSSSQVVLTPPPASATMDRNCPQNRRLSPPRPLTPHFRSRMLMEAMQQTPVRSSMHAGPSRYAAPTASTAMLGDDGFDVSPIYFAPPTPMHR